MDVNHDTAGMIRAGLTVVVLSSLAAVCRIFLTAERLTFFWFLRMWVLGFFAGTITGLLFQYFSLPKDVVNGFIGIAAIAGNELVVTIVKLATYISNHPQRALAFILRRKN